MKGQNPPWFADLAAQEVRGGRIRKARWNPGARELELVVRVPAGEAWDELLLRYRNVERLEPALPAVARIVEDVGVELAGQELGKGTGCWQHRLETTGGTLLVRFDDLFTTRRPVGAAEEPLDGGLRFEVLSC